MPVADISGVFTRNTTVRLLQGTTASTRIVATEHLQMRISNRSTLTCRRQVPTLSVSSVYFALTAIRVCPGLLILGVGKGAHLPIVNGFVSK